MFGTVIRNLKHQAATLVPPTRHISKNMSQARNTSSSSDFQSILDVSLEVSEKKINCKFIAHPLEQLTEVLVIDYDAPGGISHLNRNWRRADQH